MQLPTLTPAQIPQAALALAPSGLALMLYGSPGIGKTSILQSLGEHPGVCAWSSQAFGRKVDSLPVVTLSAPELNVEDLLGVPTVEELIRSMPDGKERAFKVTRWALPAMFDPSRPFVLFVDEPNRCEASVRNALFQLITGRTTSAGFALPKGSLVVMAGNRLEDRAGVRSLDTAFNNRCSHFELVVDPEAWLEWASQQIAFSPMVRAFISRHPSYLCRFEAGSAAPQQPTPRTWGGLGFALANAPQELHGGLAESLVGLEAGNLFSAFLANQRFAPSLKELLENPEKVPIPRAGGLDHAWILSIFLGDFLSLPGLKGAPEEIGLATGVVLGRLAREGFEEVVTFALRRTWRTLQAAHRDSARFLSAVRRLSTDPAFSGFMTAVLQESK